MPLAYIFRWFVPASARHLIKIANSLILSSVGCAKLKSHAFCPVLSAASSIYEHRIGFSGRQLLMMHHTTHGELPLTFSVTGHAPPVRDKHNHGVVIIMWASYYWLCGAQPDPLRTISARWRPPHQSSCQR